MSAIYGIFRRDGIEIDPQQTKKMNKSLKHRGPDASHIWTEYSIVLGHQMLFTTKESLHEKLPLEEDGLVITADARIDNRKELSDKLGVPDSENIPDSYFILKSYQKWDEECLKELIGDFAFAIWDKNKEKLFCARDHMGIKPFYYYLTDKAFYFATEPKAIVDVLETGIKINELAVAEYITQIIYDDKSVTFYEGIYRLAAAHKLVISSKSHSIDKYWFLDPKVEIKYDSDEEYSDALLKIFTEAIKCRLRSAYPIGFSLSGGLDSSSVFSVADKLLIDSNVDFCTYSYVFKNVPESDESFWINSVLNDHEVRSYFIEGDTSSPLSDPKDVFWLIDSPIMPPNQFLDRNAYNILQKKGIRIILGGFDGDSVLSQPYMYITELFFKLQWKKMFYELKGNSIRFKDSYYVLVKQFIIRPLIPRFIRNLFKKFRYNWKEKILKEKLARDMKISELIEKFESNQLENERCLKRTHYYQITQGVTQLTFESFDSIANSYSMNYCHPFYDKRLVEFCFALPPDQKLEYGWDRIIMRRAMKNILPEEVRWRKTKSNLGVNFIRGFKKFETERIEDIFFKEYSLLEKYVNINELQKIYNDYKAGKKQYLMAIWAAVTLALWLKNINTK